MGKTKISNLNKKQHKFFRSGQTRDANFRKQSLRRLKQAIEAHQDRLLKALYEDLRKPEIEAYTSEIGFVLGEIDYALKHIDQWMKPEKVKTPLAHQPGRSFILKEPYGVTLIIGPWNYPMQLLLLPLVGAIAAGNTAVLKPSELTRNTSKAIAAMVSDYFDEEYLAVVEGGVKESQALLKERWDYIFYTGGELVGKIVMKAAAEHLTPVTLELGGKSPCIVDKGLNLKTVCRRIAFGKFFNAGQTCIAPDYVYVREEIEDDFLLTMKNTIEEFYGENPEASVDLARIVNTKHLNRLLSLIDKEKVYYGGTVNKKEKYLSPTIMRDVTWKDKVMNEEIFGPILPVLTYQSIEEVIEEINNHAKPLAMYIFTKNSNFENKILRETSSGGVCVNDTLSHITPACLPFGGVGNSGMGAYHGIHSFDTFSHHRSVLKRSLFADPRIRYAPYKLGIKTAKKLLRFMSH